MYGCATHQDVGEWVPLTEGSSSEELGQKFGVPNKNHVNDGLIFWEISPFVKQAPYAFQWNGDRITIWLPKAESITIHEVNVSECPSLASQLDALLDSVGESAKLMMADKHRNRDSIFMGSPIQYRIKYYPPDMLGHITLSNIEYFKAPWIAQVKKVKEAIGKCLEV